MIRAAAIAAAIAVLGGCGGATPDADPAPPATVIPDATAAATLRDSAKATLATLLQDPASATFDSVIVMQPPRDGDRLPAMAVCGRMGGRGWMAPRRFVYQSKWTVFVEEESNRAAFADLWSRSCAVPGGTVVVRE